MPAEIALPSIAVSAHRTSAQQTCIFGASSTCPTRRRDERPRALHSLARAVGRDGTGRDGTGWPVATARWQRTRCGQTIQALLAMARADKFELGHRDDSREPFAFHKALWACISMFAHCASKARCATTQMHQRRQRQAKAEDKPNTTEQKRRHSARQHEKFMGAHRLWLCIRWVVNRTFEQQAKARLPRRAGRVKDRGDLRMRKTCLSIEGWAEEGCIQTCIVARFAWRFRTG